MSCEITSGITRDIVAVGGAGVCGGTTPDIVAVDGAGVSGSTTLEIVAVGVSCAWLVQATNVNPQIRIRKNRLRLIFLAPILNFVIVCC